LDVCKPSENVYKDYCSKNTYLIPLESFKCTNPNQHDIDESRKSFPSGHSSTIFYTCLFLILFIHKTWTRRNLGFFPQFAQFLLLCLAFFTALSRVVDNKHHPTDVLAGSVLGIVNALFTFFYLKMFFKRYNYRNKYDSVGSGGGGVGGHTEIKMLDVDLESNAPTLKSDLHGKKSKNSYCTKTI
jgi:phosphatidate phosphatase